MNMLNKDIGYYGEDLAVNYLKRNNYIILEKNFLCKLGEIDVIAKKGDIISFIEIKSRYCDNFGKPMEAVDFYKKKRIINVSKFYIKEKKLNNFFFRFDVLEVFLNYNKNSKINFIKDAFRVNF